MLAYSNTVPVQAGATHHRGRRARARPGPGLARRRLRDHPGVPRPARRGRGLPDRAHRGPGPGAPPGRVAGGGAGHQRARTSPTRPATTYSPQLADQGATLRVRVTATNAGGTSSACRPRSDPVTGGRRTRRRCRSSTRPRRRFDVEGRRHGQLLRASATDAQDGNEPASRLSWAIILGHCTTTGCHEHPLATRPGVAERHDRRAGPRGAVVHRAHAHRDRRRRRDGERRAPHRPADREPDVPDQPGGALARGRRGAERARRRSPSSGS